MTTYYETYEDALKHSVPKIIENIEAYDQPSRQVGYFVFGNPIHTAQDMAVAEHFGLNMHKVESHVILAASGLLLKRIVRMASVTDGMSSDTPIAIDAVYSLHDPEEFELG